MIKLSRTFYRAVKKKKKPLEKEKGKDPRGNVDFFGLFLWDTKS